MNLKRIIREELEARLGTLYLIVSDDEKFIYGSGKFGGKSFEPIENFTPESILSSAYEYQEDALEKIQWAEYYKNSADKFPNSKPSTPELIALDFMSHSPKIITVDFIIQKRDEKFPMTESEEDDWDWARETQPVELEKPEDWIGRSFGYGQAIIDNMNDSEIEYGDDEEYFTILGIDENGNLPLVKYHPLHGENYDSSTSPHLLRRYISKGDWVWK